MNNFIRWLEKLLIIKSREKMPDIHFIHFYSLKEKLFFRQNKQMKEITNNRRSGHDHSQRIQKFTWASTERRVRVNYLKRSLSNCLRGFEILIREVDNIFQAVIARYFFLRAIFKHCVEAAILFIHRSIVEKNEKKSV